MTFPTGPGKHFHHRIVISRKIKFEFKSIFVTFLPFLILLQLLQIKRKPQVNGEEEEKDSDTNLRISQNSQQLTNHHYHEQ